MKNLIITILCALCSIAYSQNIPNSKTVEVSIQGNCGICKSTIEDAANIPGEAELSWNKQTKIAQLTYDTTATSSNEVLKRVAEAGYDNEVYVASNSAYTQLSDCCQYTRSKTSKNSKTSCCGSTTKKCSNELNNKSKEVAEPKATYK